MNHSIDVSALREGLREAKSMTFSWFVESLETVLDEYEQVCLQLTEERESHHHTKDTLEVSRNTLAQACQERDDLQRQLEIQSKDLEALRDLESNGAVLKSELDEARTTNARLVQAAQTLKQKFDRINDSDEWKHMLKFLHAHSWKWKGEDWSDEYREFSNALAAVQKEPDRSS